VGAQYGQEPISHVYDYHDAAGNLAYRVCRTPSKQFPVAHPDADSPTGWWWGQGGVDRVLYRLPAVLDAVRNGATIHIAAGEKDADAINSHDPDASNAVATTVPGGEGRGKWKASYTAALRGAAHVKLWRDRDETGAAHVEAVAEALRGAVERLDVVEARSGKDAFDHLKAGFDLGAAVVVVSYAAPTAKVADGGAQEGVDPPPCPVPDAAGGGGPVEEPAWIRESGPWDDGATDVTTVSREPDVTAAVDDSAATSVVGGPDVPESCWRSGFAEFRAAYTTTTETPDAYYWGAYCSVAGLVLGRNSTLAAGVEIYPNTYVVNIGASGARKDPAQQAARRLVAAVDESIRVVHGVGSPEGLLEVLHDEDRPVDVRGMLDLNELSTLLRKAKAEATSGLGPMLCTLYDCPPRYELRTRRNPVTVTNPFFSILAATTTEWVQTDVTELDIRGGLAGRLIYMVGLPKPAVPFPPRWDGAALSEAERILRAARDRHAVRREYDLAPEARDAWAAWYRAERGRSYSNTILETVSKRLHTNAWKVALVFASIEGTPAITLDQVEAAIEFANYQREAQAVVYEGFGDTKQAKIERRVVEAIRKKGRLATWEIRQRVRHTSAEELDRAVKALGRMGVIVLKQGKWCVRDGAR
jgi:hypothetical protein